MYGVESINSLLSKLEMVYGANLQLDDYVSLSVSDCVQAALYDLENYEDDSKFDSLFNKAEETVCDLAMLSAIAYYRGDSVVIFDGFPFSSEIAQLLLYSVKLSYSGNLTDAVLKKIIAYVILIEDEYIEFRGSNAYRCLKLSIMMMLYRSTIHVAILSRFVIHQMAVSVGLR